MSGCDHTGILIFGGTTEGRVAAHTLARASHTFYYSSVDGRQDIDIDTLVHVTGRKDTAAIEEFIADHNIGLVIDAAHPFASDLHANITAACSARHIPVVRLERPDTPASAEASYHPDLQSLVDALRADGHRRILLLSGAKTLAAFAPLIDETHDIYARILDRDDSRRMAADAGLDPSHLFYLDGDTPAAIIARCRPDAIVTKESGTSGGLDEKVDTARRRHIPLYILSRPALPHGYAATVYGPIGLQLAIQTLLPGYYSRRIGLTTGTCAAAATAAAIVALSGGCAPRSVLIRLPRGERVQVPVSTCRVDGTGDDAVACASVVKDGGDDPDITTGLSIVASVRRIASGQRVVLGGSGIGRVTRPGLGMAIGAPAINPVPMSMIIRAVDDYAPMGGGYEVTVSIPGGEEIARRTFNPRLGIVGGLSILGTTGVVHPFSLEAWLESVRREMHVARASAHSVLTLSSGASSEAAMLRTYGRQGAYVRYGNFLTSSLRMAMDEGFERVNVAVMIGKALKYAAGSDDTHSSQGAFDPGFAMTILDAIGVSRPSEPPRMGRDLYRIVPVDKHRAMADEILRRCLSQARRVFTRGTLTFTLIDDHANPIHHIEHFAD